LISTASSKKVEDRLSLSVKRLTLLRAKQFKRSDGRSQPSTARSPACPLHLQRVYS
jgi:hypothetical protein